MKKITSTLFLLLFAALSLSAQTTIVNFDDVNATLSAWNGTTEIVNNPASDGINSSAKACKYTIVSNPGWGNNCATVIFDNPISYKDLDHFEFMVYAPSASQIYVKLENSVTEGEEQPEAWAQVSAANTWEKLSLGFSALSTDDPNSATFDKICFFFNPNDGVADDVWYFDNLVYFGEVATPEPKAPSNLQFSAVTATSFTLTWVNDENSTGTNIFIEDPAAESGNVYITTVGEGVSTYTYTGELGGITIGNNNVYIARLEALPDDDWNAYTEAMINITEPNGNEIPFDKDFHIYICFGQSNMEGSAPIEAQDRVADARFQVLQSLDCANLGRTKAKWYSALAPVCQCYSKLSIADYFGKNMIQNLPENVKIGIVNVSVGGSDIRLFDKDIYGNYTSTYSEAWFQDKITAYGGNPYQHLIELAKIAQQSGVIKGILLHQGETNAGDAQWPNYVKSVYDNMLADLSLNANDVPLIAGEVGHLNQGGVVGSMNSIIDNLPLTIPTAHVISSEGCVLLSDNIHFNSEGVREMGKRYATKMLSLLENTSTGISKLNISETYSLAQNTPNPVHDNTVISFQIPTASYVSLKLRNMQGVEIVELAGRNYTSGKHFVNFNTENLTEGVYFYTLTVDGFSQTQKMIVK